jgi:hypothetical protein
MPMKAEATAFATCSGVALRGDSAGSLATMVS